MVCYWSLVKNLHTRLYMSVTLRDQCAILKDHTYSYSTFLSQSSSAGVLPCLTSSSGRKDRAFPSLALNYVDNC